MYWINTKGPRSYATTIIKFKKISITGEGPDTDSEIITTFPDLKVDSPNHYKIYASLGNRTCSKRVSPSSDIQETGTTRSITRHN